MSINTVLLTMLVIAAYVNLYLTIKKNRCKPKRTEMPISSKQWNEVNSVHGPKKIKDAQFESWQQKKKKINNRKH